MDDHAPHDLAQQHGYIIDMLFCLYCKTPGETLVVFLIGPGERLMLTHAEGLLSSGRPRNSIIEKRRLNRSCRRRSRSRLLLNLGLELHDLKPVRTQHHTKKPVPSPTSVRFWSLLSSASWI